MRLGIVYIEQEQYTDAISSLEKSVDLDKDDFNKFYLYQDHTTMFKNGMKHLMPLILAPT